MTVTDNAAALRLSLATRGLTLMPIAQQTRKPMFELTPADGAFGGHAAAVQDCRENFRELALRSAAERGIPLPS